MSASPKCAMRRALDLAQDGIAGRRGATALRERAALPPARLPRAHRSRPAVETADWPKCGRAAVLSPPSGIRNRRARLAPSQTRQNRSNCAGEAEAAAERTVVCAVSLVSLSGVRTSRGVWWSAMNNVAS